MRFKKFDSMSMIIFITMWFKIAFQKCYLNFNLQQYHLILYTLFLIPYFFVAAAKSLQSCLTLCDPIDGSPPGSPVPGILQARTLKWVAISFSSENEK